MDITKKHGLSKYKPEYCEQLIEHMGKGFSYLSFGGIVKVTGETMNRWQKKYVEFSDARKTGDKLRMLFWEAAYIENAVEGGSGVPSMLIFGMKNLDKSEGGAWSDKTEAKTSVTSSVTMSYQVTNDDDDKGQGDSPA